MPIEGRNSKSSKTKTMSTSNRERIRNPWFATLLDTF